MNKLILFSLLALSLVASADTPPPGTVKAKLYTGNGVTPITSTGAAGALDVNVTNSGGLSTVNQGNAGLDPWLVHFDNSSLAVTGTFWQATQPVSLLSLPSLAAGSNLIGSVNINGTVPVSGTFWQATQPVSGTVTANAGTGTFTVDASGHTVPVSGTFWQATQPVSGSVSATVSGSVTANVGTTGGLALDSTVAGLQVAQGSTTSGQSGSLALGAVTTSAPSYTTAKTSPFSLTTAGALRIDGSGSTQPISIAAALPAGSNTIGTVQVLGAVNASGSGSAAGATVSTVATLTAPANAVGFVLMNLDTSTANIRWAIGRTATTTLGQQLQPGRDSGMIPSGANVSICAESGTQNYDIQWVTQ